MNRILPRFIAMLVAAGSAGLLAHAAIDKFGLTEDEAAAVNRILLGDAAPADPAILRWRNGETLKGELSEAAADGVRWKSPLFAEPLAIAWTALRRVDQTLAAVAPADPFSIILRDGSHLYGDLISITDEAVLIRSARHGSTALKRTEVLSARRIRGDKLIVAGPTGDVGWRVPSAAKRNPSVPTPPSTAATAAQLTGGPGGALLLPYWNTGASLDLKLPERVDLEFRVRSSTRPDFQLLLGAKGAKESLRVETWDEDLVLVGADQFKVIRKISDSERSVALRICWDQKARKCSVFSPEGKWLADWSGLAEGLAPAGCLVLQGKGRNLALEWLRVREWDGQPPPKLAGHLPRVELADGRILEGEIVSERENGITVRTSAAGPPSSFPLSEVDALIFSPDSPENKEREATLAFADATLICGRISSLKGGAALIETSFTEKPLGVKTARMRQLLIAIPTPENSPPEPPLSGLDTIAIEQITLHGKLVAAGDERPRWLPVGGLAPAPLAKDASCEITRAFPSGAKVGSAAALFLTTSGDVLPGRLGNLDRSNVEIENGVFAATRLPVENLQAIIFGAAPAQGFDGFSDPGWRILRGNKDSVKMTADDVKMQPETAIGHSSIMQSSELQFSLTCDQGFGGVRLRLFSAGDDRTETANLILANLGGRLYYGMEASEGQMDGNLQQTSLGSGATALVRLRIDDKGVELNLNGVSLLSSAVPLAKRKGSGIVIKPANVFGNSERAITLSNFSAKVVPGRVSIPDVSAETRTQALTIPRFRKDDPPKHALLAMNGDVLRGEIEAATASHFGFRSGLENLRVPRERVKAVIWLKKPDKDAPPSEVKPSAADVLGKVISRRIRYNDAPLTTLVAFLQREVPGLKFKVPAMDASRRVTFQFGDQTIGKALDAICVLFNVRYRVEDDGTIVIEPGAAQQKDLVEKVYWLKPDAFPHDALIQEILTLKGVPFPAKAAARWQPNAGHLTVTNTAANHEKLAAVLDAEFGGSVGTPTHWLSLTTGARFALTVEKFEPDFISGRHPLYGQCRVPMADVHTIRTSPPDEMLATKSLEDWRLVFAPEPVLPETGGESSAAIGKPAKPFKLPLLAGGDFELAKEKGKVIVLDFWATWCGPCVKSLPGLIEAMAAFPADRVKLIGVNQSEPADQVQRFLETRKWNLSVAMDAGQNVGRQYGVEGIPHTVIIGPEGNVAWVKTGYSPDGAIEAATAVKQALAATAKATK